MAIISNGPSASFFEAYSRDAFDVIAGVNWTVNRWLVDWWVLCDWRTYADTTPLNNPRLCVPAYVPRKLAVHAPEELPRLEKHPERLLQDSIAMPDLPEDLPKWNAFSGTAALGLAWHLHADEIIVFGADMEGRDDHAGQVGASRTPQRWEVERRIWREVTAAFRRAGRRVERRLP